MTKFDDYRDTLPTSRLVRNRNGLEVRHLRRELVLQWYTRAVLGHFHHRRKTVTIGS